jgi:outer membrane protein assembly factor BamB
MAVKTHRTVLSLVVGGLLLFAAGVSAETAPASQPAGAAEGNWPGWRGPTGCGNSDDKKLPLTWNAKDGVNVLWKVELPKSEGMTPSSPIVIGDAVIVTTNKQPMAHTVTCFNTKDGTVRWTTPVPAGPAKSIDGRNSAAASTPCSDGKFVFAMFGSGVIAGLDLKDGPFDCGIGNSPVVYGDAVVFVADQYGGKSAVYGWDCKTGEVKIQEKRPNETFCHSTPIIMKVDGKDQMIYGGNKATQGLDPATGKVLWWATWGGGWLGESSSPVCGGGLIYTDNGRGGGGVILKPGGAGDVSKTNVKALAACKSDIGSPIIVGDFIYRNEGDRLKCMKLQTGEAVYFQPLAGIQAWASPVATADRVYYASAGKSYVVKAGATFEILGQGDLGDGNPASPAISDGKLFLKGVKCLWCVGEKK